jgi:hypothetical protein
MNKAKSTTVKSSHVRFGNRTIFFDVNVSANKQKYIKITQSRFMGEGKDRIYNSLVLFPENLGEFQKNLGEAASFLI